MLRKHIRRIETDTGCLQRHRHDDFRDVYVCMYPPSIYGTAEQEQLFQELRFPGNAFFKIDISIFIIYVIWSFYGLSCKDITVAQYQ